MNLWDEELRAQLRTFFYGAFQRQLKSTIAIVVPMKAWSDDHVVEFELKDIGEYLDDLAANAPERLKTLAEIGWGRDYEADRIVEDLAAKGEDTGDDNARRLLNYVYEEMSTKSGTHPGFEVQVDSEAANQWLLQEHPLIHQAIYN